MNPALVYPPEEGVFALMFEADVLPAEYQSPVSEEAGAAAGSLLGAAQLACGLLVAFAVVVVGFAGDPQSSQSSLSAVSVVPVVDPDAGTEEAAYGFAAPALAIPLSLPVAALEL